MRHPVVLDVTPVNPVTLLSTALYERVTREKKLKYHVVRMIRNMRNISNTVFKVRTLTPCSNASSSK